MGNGQQQGKYDEEWLARPIGLGLPTKRASAFKPLQASTAPTANPYLAAERRQQASYRSAATADATVALTTCSRCTAVVLSGASVCTTCCAPTGQAPGDSVQFPVPAPADPDPQIATVATDVPAYPAPEQIGVPIHSNDLPTQRTEEHSVPSVGPNPFLAAARIEQARDAVNTL